jgi:hypothetical protein
MISCFKNKSILLCAGITIIVIALTWLLFLDKNFQIKRQDNQISQENIKQVELIIDNGEGSPQIFQTRLEKDMSVFDLLKNQAEVSNIPFKSKNYDSGVFIEKIGDKKNGEEEKYWLYYVNDQMPMVSADKYLLKAGDRVEFKFEKSTF